MGVSPLQLVNLHRNRRYIVIKLHTCFFLSYFLKTNISLHLSIFYEYQQFFQRRTCFSIQPPDYSAPWPTLARSTSFFLIMLFKYLFSLLSAYYSIKVNSVCSIKDSQHGIYKWFVVARFYCIWLFLCNECLFTTNVLNSVRVRDQVNSMWLYVLK